MELFQGEMTIRKGVSDAEKVDCKIIRPCFLLVESAALNKDAGVVALFD
jgi:hypothetical protein